MMKPQQQPQQPTGAVDPTLRPPPGYSLTQPPNKWPWQKPARYADPNQAVSAIIDNLEKPASQERYLKLMLAGFTLEEIANSISISGFMQGQVSPDVAELIKGPIVTYLLGMAEDNNIDVKVFSTASGEIEEDTGPDDSTLLNIMMKRNPKMYDKVMMAGRYVEEEIMKSRSEAQNIQENSFLGVEDQQ